MKHHMICAFDIPAAAAVVAATIVASNVYYYYYYGCISKLTKSFFLFSLSVITLHLMNSHVHTYIHTHTHTYTPEHTRHTSYIQRNHFTTDTYTKKTAKMMNKKLIREETFCTIMTMSFLGVRFPRRLRQRLHSTRRREMRERLQLSLAVCGSDGESSNSHFVVARKERALL